MLLACLTTPAVGSGTERAFKADTAFGYIHVDPENVQTATQEGEAAYLAARSILALPDVRFGIVDSDYTSHRWGDVSSDGVPIYIWVFRKSSGSKVLPPPAYLLRHEIGHDLFVRYLVPSTKRGQYGGDSPDWLDEMTAVAFEGEAQRAMRRREAVRHAREGKLIPLGRFLTMVHPEMVAEPRGPASSEQPFSVREAVSDETPQFYSMAAAFYDFLVSRTENSAIIAELAGAFRNGEPLDRWLLARTGYEGREEELHLLNADFLAWIASDKRYGGSQGEEGKIGTHFRQ